MGSSEDTDSCTKTIDDITSYKNYIVKISACKWLGYQVDKDRFTPVTPYAID